MLRLLRLTLLLVPVALICLAGCNGNGPAKVAKKPKVVVTSPIVDTVMDYQDFTGRLDAVKMIEVRARVSGYVTKVPFKEGDIVKEGDLLFQIDDRPYKVDYTKAEADYKLALAERNLQEKNSERMKRLWATKAISPEDYDTQAAAYERSIASVNAAQAARDKAKLYLDYTHVTWEEDKHPGATGSPRAPMSGRISRRFVDPGNLVTADNTVLTMIVTEDPMYAYFDVDERTYLELEAAGRSGLQSAKPREPWSAVGLPVLVRLSNETEFDSQKVGYIDFVDNRIIATSGTVRMRGVIRNPGGNLKAGLFIRVRLPIGGAYDATLIPDEAIQNDQERKFVYVVNDKNEVEYRSVKLGQSIGELRVIRPADKGKEGKEGLSKTDRVVVKGMQRVRNGVAVEAENHAPPAPPGMPLVRLLKKG
ncbi:MAG TPA: efflux RND transporter periplasmic adaptor subunit [Gemmataceae bacterium]|nr:efflux RND transporter periplasmic adaptor subunit [Gemmataceae bacterium]